MVELNELYAKALAQMETCRDRAFELMTRINADTNELSFVVQALHRDVAWLRREYDARLPPEAPIKDENNG
jgi:hypothetical protein